jgi:hypothetical protein
VRRPTRRASWHAPLAARTAHAPRTRGLSHCANDRCKRRVASFQAVEGRIPKLPSRPPIRDQMGAGTCLHAWLGPRLVHTPSEPSGSQRSPLVSSGRSFAQVAGAILRKQAQGQNPDKDEVAGVIGLAVPGWPTQPLVRGRECRKASPTGGTALLGPRWVRAATAQYGHRWSPAVTDGSAEPQVTSPSAHAAGITQTRDSDCGPEGRGSSLLGYPTAARATRHRDAAEVAVRALRHRGRNQRPGRGQPSSRVRLPGMVPRR